MKNKLLSIILISTTAIVLLSIIYVLQRTILKKEKEVLMLKHHQTILQNSIMLQWENDNAILSECVITDESNNILDNQKLIEKTPLIVFRFSQLNCTSCIQKQTDILNEFIKIKNVGSILVSDYDNLRNLSLFKRLNGIESIVYNCEKLLSTENVSPYFFVLTKNGEIENVYFPDDDFPNLTKKYLEIVTKKYFDITTE